MPRYAWQAYCPKMAVVVCVVVPVELMDVLGDEVAVDVAVVVGVDVAVVVCDVVGVLR